MPLDCPPPIGAVFHVHKTTVNNIYSVIVHAAIIKKYLGAAKTVKAGAARTKTDCHSDGHDATISWVECHRSMH
jgi:hypothetical protein